MTQLIFDASALSLPLTMADPVSRQLAYSELERSLEELGAEHEILARVRSAVERTSGGFRSLEEVASGLHLSTRTLKRRLAAQGLTYSNVLEEQRREKALLLLRSPLLRSTRWPNSSVLGHLELPPRLPPLDRRIAGDLPEDGDGAIGATEKIVCRGGEKEPRKGGSSLVGVLQAPACRGALDQRDAKGGVRV